jgi:protein-tyrosine phosphatase
MTPLVDTHCHLLPGLDDGPASMEEATGMCRIAWDEGVRVVAATAHMSPRWPQVTAARIRECAKCLAAELRTAKLPLSIYPSAEIAVEPDLDTTWSRGELLSVADNEAYLLIEYPTGVFVDLSGLLRRLVAAGVRPILAHPERQAELLHERDAVESLIELGCLIQVSSNSITDPPTAADGQAVKRWIRRGVVHLIASDGHSCRTRAPRMAQAYRTIERWAGTGVADRICSLHGLAVLEGRPLRLPQPEPAKKRWLAMFTR